MRLKSAGADNLVEKKAALRRRCICRMGAAGMGGRRTVEGSLWRVRDWGREGGR